MSEKKKRIQYFDISKAPHMLVAGSTGSGKTYLAAFDVNAYNPKKFLFIIHREQIARKAMESFKRVIGYGKNMAVLSGNEKDYDADFIFATIRILTNITAYFIGKCFCNKFTSNTTNPIRTKIFRHII